MVKLCWYCIVVLLHQWKFGSSSDVTIGSWNTTDFDLELTLDPCRNVVKFSIMVTTSFVDEYWAFGISADTNMPLTDIYMVEHNGGQVNVSDRVAFSRVLPQKDTVDDITLTSSSLEGSNLLIEFERATDTLDGHDFSLSSTFNFYILYAHGDIIDNVPSKHNSTRISPMTYRVPNQICEATTSTESSTSEAETIRESTSTQGSQSTLDLTTQDSNATMESKANAHGTFGCSFYSWQLFLRITNVIIMVHVSWACFV